MGRAVSQSDEHFALSMSIVCWKQWVWTRFNIKHLHSELLLCLTDFTFDRKKRWNQKLINWSRGSLIKLLKKTYYSLLDYNPWSRVNRSPNYTTIVPKCLLQLMAALALFSTLALLRWKAICLVSLSFHLLAAFLFHCMHLS